MEEFKNTVKFRDGNVAHVCMKVSTGRILVGVEGEKVVNYQTFDRTKVIGATTQCVRSDEYTITLVLVGDKERVLPIVLSAADARRFAETF